MEQLNEDNILYFSFNTPTILNSFNTFFKVTKLFFKEILKAMIMVNFRQTSKH